MKAIIIFFFSTILFSAAASEEVKVTAAMKRETLKSVSSYFSSNEKSVKEISGLTGYKCGDDQCLYYVDSFANGQIGHSFQYGLHECRTLINKKGNKLIENGSECDFID